MKYTGETRAMLKVKRHINKMSKETGIIDLIENKVKAEEIICSMKARRELSKRGYLSLRKHVKERIDSKLDAIPGKTACVAEATIR